jgi:predicted AAA+ superfamily ATPase
MDYQKRIVDERLRKYLKVFGAVLVEGPKWCGKTWTAEYHSKSKYEVADPKANFRNRELARLNPNITLTGEQPHLIDEWQEVPPIKDAVRYAVDHQPGKGQYILTGSSTPDDNATVHSGTGRIGNLKMSTMTLSELGISNGSISLNKLFNNSQKITPFGGGLSIDDIANIVTRGGWPGLLEIPDVDLAMEVIRSYIDNIANVDLSKIDGIKRNPLKIAALIRSLARNVATYVSNETIRQDIDANQDSSVTVQKISEYMNLLERIFVFCQLPSWSPALKSPIRLRQAPKRFLVDPSLTVAALGADPQSLLEDTKLLGGIFESLVLHDLLVYSDANDAKVFQYHDNTDLEIDAIVEKRNGQWAGIEIKLGYYGEDEAAANLLKLRSKMIDAKQKPPEFLAVIIGVGGICKKRSDGVFVVPIDCLGV